jgi:RNA-directed DNA polymerase
VVNAKPYDIPKRLVWDAYQKVKTKRGAAGVDGESLKAFEENVKDNLYKIWNRLSSGSYLPPPVRLVEIPKGNGGMRPLGIPTVSDRIAQMVAKMTLEPLVEPHFHPSSFGYRPGKSALEAVGVARERCWHTDWVVDLDIKGFFDTLDHALVERAVAFHTDIPWVKLFVGRWLRAPLQKADGTLEERTKGTPQGGVISPLLANLYLHYAFDAWVERIFPSIRFERYADDILVHCESEEKAIAVLEAVRNRFKACGLELHPVKTRIVYCKDDNRPGSQPNTTFDFLGYTFRPREAKTRGGIFFVGFQPAMSTKAANKVREAMRNWRIPAMRSNQSLADVANLVNATLRGWLNYYGRFYRSECVRLFHHFNGILATWAGRKFKRFRYRKAAAVDWLAQVSNRCPNLFVHWQQGIKPHGWSMGAV